ncbi:MAG: LysR family transcriptional regulator [Rhodococcus sp. (in: high G+C Gram-positive bacteria)]
MDITIQQLRCFVAAAEQLHFGRAAQQVHVSPSTFSENVATIERRIGRALFVRDARKVRLTGAGTDLLPLARHAVAGMNDVVRWAEQRSATPKSVRVGLMVSSARFRAVMAAAIPALPQFDWEIRHLGFTGAYRALDDGEVDCAFITEARGVPARYSASPQWAENAVVVMPVGHRLAERDTLTAADLSGESLIAVRDSEVSDRWLPAFLGPTPDVETLPIAHTFEEVVELCIAGLGINIAGESARFSFANDALVFKPLSGVPELTTYLCRSPRTSVEHLAPFVDVLDAVTSAPGF